MYAYFVGLVGVLVYFCSSSSVLNMFSMCECLPSMFPSGIAGHFESDCSDYGIPVTPRGECCEGFGGSAILYDGYYCDPCRY